MNNENLVLKVKHGNWALTAPGNWQYTIWMIYGDLKMEVVVSNGYEEEKETNKNRPEKLQLNNEITKAIRKG